MPRHRNSAFDSHFGECYYGLLSLAVSIREWHSHIGFQSENICVLQASFFFWEIPWLYKKLTSWHHFARNSRTATANLSNSVKLIRNHQIFKHGYSKQLLLLLRGDGDPDDSPPQLRKSPIIPSFIPVKYFPYIIIFSDEYGLLNGDASGPEGPIQQTVHAIQLHAPLL